MTPTQNRIKHISQLFRLIFQFLFLMIPILHILAWVNAPNPIDISGAGRLGFFISAMPKGIEIMYPLATSTRIYGLLISAIPIVLAEAMIYFLIRLFRLYQNGEIFSLNNVRYIKKTGIMLLILQLVKPICDGLLSAFLTLGNPHGHRYAKITISGTDISMLLTALLIILISWIMAEGCRLREEQQLTI